MPVRAAFRFPHAMASVVQMLRLQVAEDIQRNVAEAVALMDDRDRWVEDNLQSLNDRIGIVAGLPSGALVDWAGLTAPDGFLLCDGGAISREDFAGLFAAIGNRWGAGDGSTTFNVPDFRGRVAVGAGTGTGLTGRTVGQSGGEERHVLTIPEMPAHTHPIVQGLVNGAIAGGSGPPGVQFNPAGATGSTGSGTAHNVMQPYAVVTKIIKT